MSEGADGATPSPAAWQPFTFGGVAAFARAGVSRLLLAELVTAAIVGAGVVAFLQHAWVPVISQAIEKMPETAAITNGEFIGFDQTLITETKFLAIAISPESTDQIGQSADIQIQFRPTDFRVGTSFRPNWGWEFDYGPGTGLALGRSVLEPWWGAWRPVLLAGIGIGVVVIMFGIWALVAVIYTVPAKLTALFADRELSWFGAWRLASASMLAGAFLVVAGIYLYSAQVVDLVGLVFIWAAHVVMGWVHLFGGVWASPRLSPKSVKQNPFIS
jgi:hypothetical protein